MTNAVNIAQIGSTGVTTGFKNKLINGNFDFWQRGTTNTITTSGYTVADRWQYITDGTLSTGSVFTQQTFTLGQTAVPNNPTYYLNWQYTSVNTPSNYIRQRIENVATCSGQTITLSVWVKCSSGTVAMGLGYQQEFGTGGSPSAGYYPTSVSFTATTTWTQYTATYNVASISGKTIGTNNDSAINIVLSCPTSGSNTISVSQFQCEIGNAATNFDIRPLQVELALCQRYCCVIPVNASGIGTGIIGPWGANYNSTNGRVWYSMPVTMRTTPSVSLTGNQYSIIGVNDVATGTNANFHYSNQIISFDGTSLSSSSATGQPLNYRGGGLITAEL